MSEPKFTWNDIVGVASGASTSGWTSSSAWIVGITPEETRSGDFLEKYPTGYVYTIEFADGSSTEVPENDLVLLEAAPPGQDGKIHNQLN